MLKKICFVLVLLLTFIYPEFNSKANQEIVRDRDYYIAKYLKIFTNLTPAEVLTVIMAESKGDVNAVTYEPKVKDISYGPMQVRLKTARIMKFRGDPKILCTWEYGLYYGMKYLSWKKEEAYRKSHDKITRRKHMWAGYNAGKPILVYKHGEWVYVNQEYVDTCEMYHKKLEKFNEDTKYYMEKSVAFFTEKNFSEVD